MLNLTRYYAASARQLTKYKVLSGDIQNVNLNADLIARASQCTPGGFSIAIVPKHAVDVEVKVVIVFGEWNLQRADRNATWVSCLKQTTTTRCWIWEFIFQNYIPVKPSYFSVFGLSLFCWISWFYRESDTSCPVRFVLTFSAPCFFRLVQAGVALD